MTEPSPAAPAAPLPWPEQIQGIAERFAEVVAAVPDAQAVSDPDRVLTYTELDDHSRRLAALIDAAGGAVGDPVALLIDHDVDLVVAMVAAVRAGRPFTVIDPATPAQRMLQVCDDLGDAVIVTSAMRAGLARQLSLGLAPVVEVDDASMAQPLPADAEPQPTAGIFYTSGSTGEPKGGMRSQPGIVRRVRFEDAGADVGPGDVISLLYSCSYGSSQNDLWTGLLTGARVAMYPVAQLGVAPLAAWIREQGLTWFHIPIALLRQFISLLPPDERFDTVRVVIPSGRQYGSDITALRRHFRPDVRIYSQFGSTETSIAARYVVDPDDQFGDGEIIPIGYEVPDARIDIVDDDGEPVPDGEEGQLLISSAMLSHGYWNRPEQSNAVFTPDPQRAGFRRYATGDYGRRDDRGRVVFIGRRDDRVKVRGYRIELNEVAGHIRGLDAVGEAHVGVDPDQPERLVAYVVPAAGTTFDPTALRDQLGERVATHLVPSLFVEMSALPLTANGKIDASGLPDIAGQRPQTSRPYEQPGTATEHEIAAIWAETLAVDDIGVHDSFAELGGDSIGAMRVVALVAERCHTEIPLRQLLERGTVATMAALVDDAANPTSSALPVVGPDPQPLSHQQMNIWLSEQMGGHGRFNMAKVVDIAGPIDIAKLEQALTELCARHDVLRTLISFTGAEPTQSSLDAARMPLPVLDLTGRPAAEAAAAVDAVIEQHATTPFHLDRDRPLRAELCTLGPTEHVLIVTTHHIASDRTSSTTLFDDLSALYRAAVGSGPALAPLPNRYADFASWQRTRTTPARTEAALAHWRAVLDPRPRELTPLVRANPEPHGPHRGLAAWTLDEAATATLQAVAREEQTTVFVVVLALLKMALSTVTGVADPSVGAIMSGRDRAELEGMVGCFITLYPVVSSIPPDVGFRDRVRLERDAFLGVMDHADVPFDALVADLNPERRPGRTPFSDVTLNFGSSPERPLDLGEAVGHRRPGRRHADNPFDVRAWPADDCLHVQVTIDRTWIDPDVAAAVDTELRRLAHHFARDADGS